MPSGFHLTSTWSWVINLCWRGLVVIKGSSIAYQWTSRKGKIWRFRNGYGRWWPEEVLSDRNPTTPQEKEKLVEFFRKNIDVFAWKAYEILGVDLSFICHHLNINPSITPKKKSPRRSSKEHANAVKDEMMKLKQARAIKEVFYPKWLANTVVVKKKNGKWRVCEDFTDLNKDCLKNPFPIPRID